MSKMQVFVKAIDNTVFVIRSHPSDSVSQFKANVKKQTGIPINV